MRIRFFVTLIGATLPSILSASRPNIVYILCDDLGYGDVGVFHQNMRAGQKDAAVPFFRTPQIDTLARDGMMLTHHYCAAPVCAPSRASFLTGRTQGHATVRDNQFDKALPDTHTVGSILKQAGYRTAAIGKWGLQGKLPKNQKGSPKSWEAFPTKRGFDFFFGYIRHRDGHFHYPKEDQREVWENDQNVGPQLDLCFTTDLFTTRAKKWITDHTRSDDKPFFLFLAFDTPHAVLHNPPCAFPNGGGLKGGLQWSGKPGEMINTAKGTMDGWMHPDYQSSTWDHDNDPQTGEIPWPEAQKRYANNVRRIDDCVGDLLRLLDDLKISDNTMVVFTSDNGPSKESYLKAPYNPDFFNGFGPFNGIKRDTLEGGLREPTLVRWPKTIQAGKVDPRPSGQWDWLATFADVAGVPNPATSDGVSLLPYLSGKGQRRDATLYVEYLNHGKTPGYPAFAKKNRGRKRGQMQVVLAEGYKGLRYNVKSASDDFEIYDLAKDPAEANNLAKEPGFQKLQELFKAKALQARIPNSSAKRPYDKAPIPPSPNPTGKPGITRSLYTGDWPWLPEFRDLSPDSSKIVQSIGLPEEKVSSPFGLSFEGFFFAKEEGLYQFKFEGKGSAAFFVHDCRIISESKPAVARSQVGSIQLKSGWHPIHLHFKSTSGTSAFQLTTTGPDGQKLPMDATTLRSK